MPTQIRNTDPLVQSLADAVNNVKKRSLGNFNRPHYDTSEVTVTAAAATDLSSAITLLHNLVKVLYGLEVQGGAYVTPSGPPFPGHFKDALVHDASDTTSATLSAAFPTNQATADTLADEIKTDFNAHLTRASIHPTNDNVNAITNPSSNGTLARLLSLVNDARTKVLAHLDDGVGGGDMLRVVPA